MGDSVMNTEPVPSEVGYVGNAPVAERMDILHKLSGLSGIRLVETFFPEGTGLIQYGEEKKRRLNEEIKALPELVDALKGYRFLLEQEQHRDFLLPIQHVRMDPSTGGLYGKDNPNGRARAVGYDRVGFGHVVGFLKPPTVRAGFADTLLWAPKALRADLFNHAAASHARKEMVTMRTAVEVASQKRFIRAVTSERHSLSKGDDAAVAAALEARVPRGAKCRITRESSYSSFELLWPAMERQIVVGDIAVIGLEVRNSETKQGSLKITAKLLQTLCVNFTTVWAGKDEEIELRHIGDLTGKLTSAVIRTLAKVEPFVKAFGDAYQDTLPNAYPTRGEVLARVGYKYALPEKTLDLAGQFWDAHPTARGDTRATLVNALTRASQHQTIEAAAETERVAGRVVVEGWNAL